MVRQSIIVIVAMALLLLLAAFDEWSSRTAAAKQQISGTVTQWSTLGLVGRDNSVSFRVGTLASDLRIDAATLSLLAKHGVTQPVDVGARVEAIVVKSEAAAARQRPDRAAIPVLALRVNGQTLFGAPEAFRLRRSIDTWPYLLLLSAFGAALFFSQKRRRRRSRRV